MAVICRTNSIYHHQGINNKMVLLFVLFQLAIGSQVQGLAVQNNQEKCAGVADMVKQQFSDKMVLNSPATGLYCKESCCSADLENSMVQYTHLYAEKFLRDSITKINQLVDNRAKKFDESFLTLMNNSKLEFHNMFKRTYGKTYMANADVFSDFFTELETYYKKGNVGLSDTLDKFFVILFQRMFTVMNNNYSFDQRYLDCVAEHMGELKPFGDVSQKLSVQLRRAFGATRMFYKALQLSAHVSQSMLEFRLDQECQRELMQMQFCGVCGGFGSHKGRACLSYCTETMDRCLNGFGDLSKLWDNMIDSIDKVGDRLLGPYNIEAVVEPMNIKVSEAIMNFQEAHVEILKKIYGLCGKPAINNRPKRKSEYRSSAEDDRDLEVKFETLKPGKQNRKKHHHKATSSDNVENVTTLEKVIQEIKLKIKDAKKFWSNLRYQYCNNDTISSPPTNESDCRQSSFTTTTTLKKPHPLVEQQTYQMGQMTANLKKAFQGQEVELIDEEDINAGEDDGGSGSGSGAGIPDDDDDDLEPPEPKYPYPNRNDVETRIDLDIDPVKEIAPVEPTSPPEVVQTASNAPPPPMCLNRALLNYVLPIVLAWFGGAITDLL